MTFRVADLFCGPGGISEGLRQAGCRTVYALDHDAAAVETFAKNHPEARVVRRDVTSLDADELPDFDILVGGPPCVEFSNSKGSRGNVLEGLRLVQEFLRVVYVRSPPYWIMENVPRIMLHLPDEIPLRWIGIDKPGVLHVPTKAEFNCADYGVPQARRRFLMGHFPIPLPTHGDGQRQGDLFGSDRTNRPSWRTLETVLDALPDPIGGPRPPMVIDPTYDLTMPVDRLTDHSHPVLLSPDEVRSIRRAKVDHPFMGRMAFPDATDRPARTVVATQLGRETLVIGGKTKGREVFRRATVRECATLQTFPISYQFFGGSLNARYRLAGDAVPPRLTYLIGQEICRLEKVPVSSSPILLDPPAPPSHPVGFASARRRMIFPLQRRFCELVPGKEVRGCRVELDNCGPNPVKAQLVGKPHPVEWCSRLFLGEGTASLKTRALTVEEVLSEISGHCCNAPSFHRTFRQLLQRAEKVLVGKIPDATTVQAVWARKTKADFGPEEIVDVLSDLINGALPSKTFANEFIQCSGRSGFMPNRGLRVRIAAALLITAYCCELLNADGRWALRHPGRRFLLEGWKLKKSKSAKTIAGLVERFDKYTKRAGGSRLALAASPLAVHPVLNEAH
jgi:DNA (cytosine-5)-methyltransferase 1